MDPVGPWSAYASYNRLPGVQVPSGGDIQSHLVQSVSPGTPPTTTAQILPAAFLSATPIGYDTVFSPIFQQAGSKPPVHYVTPVGQQRQPVAQVQPPVAATTKQPAEGEYQGQAYFDQSGTAWQQNSPFGVLPHESIVPTTTTSKSVGYENFNAHFAAAQSHNHLNTQLVASNSKSMPPRVQTTLAITLTKPTPQPNSPFFQVPATFANTESSNVKTYVPSDASNLQQSCIVTSPSSSSKDYRVPQAANRGTFLNTPARPGDKSFSPLSDKQALPQIQTKAQTKIYPELNNQTDRQRPGQLEENQTQSSPTSFSMEGPGCVNYTNSSTAKRPQFQSSNFRHYQPGNNTETEFPCNKSIEYNNSNGSDCTGVVQRRASPLQAHPQVSPLGHAQSPVYPMYNSPLNSVPSPQQPINNQVTTPSPLDATVVRSSSQTGGNISYPSVITRALNSDKKFSEHYDRSIQQSLQNAQPGQDCWEERQTQQQQRKFQTVPTNYTSVNNLDIPPRIGDQCQQQNLSMQDRQQVYFHTAPTHQVPLQDLSSYRRDPISLVKTLQPQQQSCQVQSLDVKGDPKTKRRKNNDKLPQHPNEISQGTTLPEYFAGRIPPPAHSSASNQQQNGAYFDFDRWNLPPPHSKMFATQPIHQQHQGIMVAHPHSHHPPPPLPYFPPYHMPPHPEYPSNVEHNSIAYNDQSAQQQNANTQLNEQNGQPKVVVPNIEEELEFLSSTRTVASIPTQLSKSTNVPPPVLVNQVSSTERSSGTAGFMNSYLKFLQGDRASSPPPAARANRKQSWSRTKPTQSINTETNGVVATPAPPPHPIPATRLSQGDPQDDPRYFPLPKERKKDRFNSSDDGFTSEEDLFTKKVTSLSGFSKERNFKRSRPPNRQVGVAVKRKPKRVVRPRKEKEFDEDKVPLVETSSLPRRESSRRAAKDKSNLQQMIADDELDQLDYIDSDSDPAWSPKRNEDNEVVAVMSKGRKVKYGGKRRPSRNLITAAAHCAGINDADGYISDGTGTNTKTKIGIAQVPKPSVAPTLEDNIAAAVAQQVTAPTNAIDNHFKHGEFLVVKSDLSQEFPPIWRVDGKSLLQRYEPFEQNGQTLYKNVQTYTAWTQESIKQYTVIPINFKVQTQTETIVEFVRKAMMSPADFIKMEKLMDASKVFQDNFEVYIQTLISQALDSNFLTEIFQEQDEYFLSNVKTIDDITESKRHKMIYFLQWTKILLIAVSTWPCFNVINELSTTNIIRPCSSCLRPGISVRVLMYGQPYNSTTLEASKADAYNLEKDFLMCRMCANRVELFNKITHQKYLMYIQCAKKVAEKRTMDPNKDTTCILNELLADETWLNKLFCDVRYSWAEVDCLDCRYKLNNQCSDSSNDKTVV